VNVVITLGNVMFTSSFWNFLYNGMFSFYYVILRAMLEKSAENQPGVNMCIQFNNIVRKLKNKYKGRKEILRVIQEAMETIREFERDEIRQNKYISNSLKIMLEFVTFMGFLTAFSNAFSALDYFFVKSVFFCSMVALSLQHKYFDLALSSVNIGGFIYAIIMAFTSTKPIQAPVPAPFVPQQIQYPPQVAPSYMVNPQDQVDLQKLYQSVSVNVPQASSNVLPVPGNLLPVPENVLPVNVLPMPGNVFPVSGSLPPVSDNVAPAVASFQQVFPPANPIVNLRVPDAQILNPNLGRSFFSRFWA